MNRLKRRKPLKMGTREEARVRCAQHLQWVRGHECAIAGKLGRSPNGLNGHYHVCAGKIQAAHVRIEGDGGLGIKPGDDKTVPLCEGAHMREQHNVGERTFWTSYRIDPHQLAAELWARSPHGQKYRAKGKAI